MKAEELIKQYKDGKRYFTGVDLRGVDLTGVDLRGVDLRGANLRGAYLPAPTVVLLARWGIVSDKLCGDLMRYDAYCHEDSKKFGIWAKGGTCPYTNKKYERAANFEEKKELWKAGPPKKVFNLMVRVIQETCANSDWHKKEVKQK